MFEFDRELRSADPVRDGEIAMPDFSSMAQRISATPHTSPVTRSTLTRVKIGAGMLAVAIVALSALSVFAPSPTPGSRSARRAFWVLPTTKTTSNQSGSIVSGNNFDFVAATGVSSTAGTGSIYQIDANLTPLKRFSVFANAFGVTTSAGITSTTQPQQIVVVAGDPSSASGQLTYGSYTGTNSVQYSFNQFHFVADDAESLLYSNQTSTTVSYADQRRFLSLAQSTWRSVKSAASLDTALVSWQQLSATSADGSTVAVTRVLIPLAIQGTQLNQSVTFEFTAAGTLISAAGPDIVITKVIKVPYQSARSGIYDMNRGVNIPCVTIYSDTALSAGGGLVTTTVASTRTVTLETSSVLLEAQRTTAQNVVLIPFYRYSGHLGATAIGGFLGSTAVDSSHISITKSPSGACATTLLGL